jgi:single-strand DNA-binding protein
MASISCLGKTADIIGEICYQGKEIAIEGKLTHRSYDDKNGEKRYVTEVVVTEVLLLGSNLKWKIRILVHVL